MPKTIRIRNTEDLLTANSLGKLYDVRVLFDTNVIRLPSDGLAVVNANNVEFIGPVLFTGGSFNLVTCKNVTCKGIAFRVERPIGKLPTRYEKSWKPLRVYGVTPDKICVNIRFEQCSFSGHTDELSAGPLDHASWFKLYMGRPAVIGLTFDRCIFGPSFVNRSPDRIFHNFNIACSLVDDCTFTGCVFFGANRRSPQIAGLRAKIVHCVVCDWGTGGVMWHSGARGEVNACHFIRGPHTNSKERAVSLVEVLDKDPFAVLGPVRLAITPNCTEYGIDWKPLRKGWDCWQEPKSPLWVKVPSSGVQVLRKPDSIINAAGAGDALDKAIRRSLVDKRHLPWVEDYSAGLAFPN